MNLSGSRKEAKGKDFSGASLFDDNNRGVNNVLADLVGLVRAGVKGDVNLVYRIATYFNAAKEARCLPNRVSLLSRSLVVIL
jgi:hypothetical protein